MMISTKGRYALRVILDLAKHSDEGYISLKSIAQRQEISLKYLEMVVATMNKAGLVDSQRGKDGGYKLNKSAAEYTVGEILRVAEGELAPVNCLECGEETCKRAKTCLTLPMWEQLEGIINGYLDSISIADLLEGKYITKED